MVSHKLWNSLFAPPAIAFAIGAYLNIFMPSVPILVIAIIFYLIFTALNIYGVEAAAVFELFITVIAVIGLLLFAGAVSGDFEWKNMQQNALPNGWGGAFAAIPFAIWFFLAIEGVANVAEETINPQRNILIGFGSAILTLVVLCLITFSTSIGVGGWEQIVFDAATGESIGFTTASGNGKIRRCGSLAISCGEHHRAFWFGSIIPWDYFGFRQGDFRIWKRAICTTIFR